MKRHLLILALFTAVLAACSTTRKSADGSTTTTQPDPKTVKVITKAAVGLGSALLKSWLNSRAPTESQTIYDGPRIITSEVPW